MRVALAVLLLLVPGVQACHNASPWMDAGNQPICAAKVCPLPDGPLVVNGTLDWYWQPVNDCPDPGPLGLYSQDIRIAARPYASDAAWFTVRVTPEDLRVPAAERAAPGAFQPTGTLQAPVAEHHVLDFQMVFEKVRDPTPAEALAVLEDNGTVRAYVRFEYVGGAGAAMTAIAVAGGAFDAEAVARDFAPASANQAAPELPGPGLGLVLAALALGMVVLRRKAA